MNIAVGGEYGWLTKYIPGTDNGLKCNYAGFTGAATFLYSMDKETSFFVEPRVVVANFREPYVNVARRARLCSQPERTRLVAPLYLRATPVLRRASRRVKTHAFGEHRG